VLICYHISMEVKRGVLSPVDRRGAIGVQVYEGIRDAILNLTLPPGSALSEKELAAELGISRTPVREAFLRLAREGLVVIYPQSGTFVSKIDPAAVEEGRFVREAVECAAVERAATRATAENVAELKRQMAAQRAVLGSDSWSTFFELDEQFHRTVIEIAGYPLVWRITQEVRLHVERLRRLSLPDAETVGRLVEQHAAVADAIAAGDGAAARDAMSVHLGEASRVVERLAAQHPDYFTT
jgi:DNA-binding GntR family transcriptional regulator